MSNLDSVARFIQSELCVESVTLLHTVLQVASMPNQEPAAEPTETEHIFQAGINPIKAKATTAPGGLQIPADYSAFVYIPDFQRRTGVTVDVSRLDWLLHDRLRIRGALCSITHAHVTGPDSIWLTIFAAREQV